MNQITCPNENCRDGKVWWNSRGGSSQEEDCSTCLGKGTIPEPVLEKIMENKTLDGIKIGEVLRNAYDEFWTENPPKHEYGTPGYYEWYKQQNEFVANTLLEAIQAPTNRSIQELNEIKFILSRREALSHWNTDADKIRAMINALQKLDPFGDAMKDIKKLAEAQSVIPIGLQSDESSLNGEPSTLAPESTPSPTIPK